MKTSNSIKDKLKAVVWSVKLAWEIDKKMLVFWFGISIALSILPAIALLYNKKVISTISLFLSTGQGNMYDAVESIVMLGIILTAVGLSSRINGDLLYMMMYDSYYLGMEEQIIDKVQKIELKTFLNKDIKDEYNAIICRAGSLTDFMSSTCTFVSKMVSIISLLIVAFSASKLIFAISTIYITFTIFFNFKYTEKTRVNRLAIVENERKASYFQNMPLNTGIAKEIRIYENYEDILNQWNKSYESVENQDRKYAFETEKRSLISGLIFYVFMIAIIAYSIFQVSNHSMSADVFLMIYVLCQNISNAINGVAKSIIRADYGLFSLERQQKFILNVPEFNLKITQKNSVNDNETVFELKNVTFEYKDECPVLKNVNLKIKKDETIALVGYNGSGKTTLVNLLLNLFKPTSGEIYFNGIPYSSYDKDEITKHIGVFFQNYYLFHASLKDNVGYGNLKNINNIDKIKQAISNGGLQNVLDKLPKGLDNWLLKDVEPEGAILSGGEKQKVAISRTYMSDRDVMIFDEPAAALDPIAEMQQFLNIKNTIKNKTSILISHRIGFARLADRILVLDKGIIVEDGTHEDLMKKDGLYSYFFNEQAQWYTSKAKEEDVDAEN